MRAAMCVLFADRDCKANVRETTMAAKVLMAYSAAMVRSCTLQNCSIASHIARGTREKDPAESRFHILIPRRPRELLPAPACLKIARQVCMAGARPILVAKIDT
jgi:hypothetical protein